MKSQIQDTKFHFARIMRKITAQLTPQENMAIIIIAFLFMLGTFARLLLSSR